MADTLLGFELPNRPDVLPEEWARFDALPARLAKLRPYHVLGQAGAANLPALRERRVAVALRPNADGPIDAAARLRELEQAIDVLSGLDPLFVLPDSEPNLGGGAPPAGYWDRIEAVRSGLATRYGSRVRTVSPPLAVAQNEEAWLDAGRAAVRRFDYFGAHAYGQGDSGLALRCLDMAARCGIEQPVFVAEVGDSSPPSVGPLERAGFLADYLRRLRGRVAACCLFILGTADSAWECFVLPLAAVESLRNSLQEGAMVTEIAVAPARVPAHCYEPLVRLCAEYQVDVSIIAGMIAVESGWDALAIGDGGHAVGLLQLHDQGQGAGLTVTERQDPAVNLRVGIRAFRAHLDQFGSVEAAIAAHNGGAAALRSAGGDWRALYGGSVARSYVEPVLAKAAEYRRTGIQPQPAAPVQPAPWQAVRTQLDAIWGVSEQLLAGRADQQAWALRSAVMAIKDAVGLG